MTVVYNIFSLIKIRLGPVLSLIFFMSFFAEGCRQKEAGITIIWNGKQATGLFIAKNFLQNEPLDSAVQYVQIRLENSGTNMLGELKIKEDQIEFIPFIPLSNGMLYDVLLRNRVIGKIQIPMADPANAPYIVNVFPAADTVPENLLKIYVQFSSPMREGEALQHIFLLNEHHDTVPNIFLDLQPELWNKERTVLTVWLDPGRIKRDLIPNRQLGNPLQKGKQYTVSISNKWQGVQNLPLRQSFTRQFVVGVRDSISPQPAQWLLELPAAKTTDGLGVKFDESLDYFLLAETIQIRDEKGNQINGKSGPLNNGTGFAFWPENPWQPGQYRLRVAAELEDLAGNNLNRLFDRDLQVKTTDIDKDYVEKVFNIRPVK